jgi:hypothetical protein
VPYAAEDLRIDGTQVYLAVPGAGLVVIDIADPVRPIVVGSQRVPGFPLLVELLGGRACVVDCPYGLRILSTQCAASILDGPTSRRLHPAPNPTRDWTAIPFRLRRAGAVTVDVTDVSGRGVRRVAGVFAPGEHRLIWNGRDDRGRSAASGIYQMKMTTPGGERSGHIVRIE